jgi:hypothetical protein
MFGHGVGPDGLVETRPAGAGLEFRPGRKQRLAAADAGEEPYALLKIERTRTGSLGPMLARNFILLRRQLLSPLGIALFNAPFHGC